MAHSVYRAMNSEVQVFGVEKRLFFCVGMAALATFQLLSSMMAAVFVFAVLFAFALRITKDDPRMFVVAMAAVRMKCVYDPGNE